ncbi:helix-turn-helix domain-containing protein, partial [Bacillus subtilis]
NAPFLSLFNKFKDEHLATLEPGPLRLYLYFAFHANNKSGYSWHSIQTMAKFFKTQTRTIDNWIKVLVDKNLIYRERTDKLSNTTFLVPYSNTVLRHAYVNKKEYNDQELLDDLISLIKRRRNVYGEIVKVYHIFQWVMKKGKRATNNL